MFICRYNVGGGGKPRIISCFGTLQADLQNTHTVLTIVDHAVRTDNKVQSTCRLKFLSDDIFKDCHCHVRTYTCPNGYRGILLARSHHITHVRIFWSTYRFYLHDHFNPRAPPSSVASRIIHNTSSEYEVGKPVVTTHDDRESSCSSRTDSKGPGENHHQMLLFFPMEIETWEVTNMSSSQPEANQVRSRPIETVRYQV